MSLLTTLLGSGSQVTGPGTDAFVTVAAADTPALQKAQADYVCTGTNDASTLNAATAALASVGGEVILLPGTYGFADNTTWHVVTDGAGSAAKPITVRFSGGAVLDVSAFSSSADFAISVESWNADIFNPTVRGGGRNDGIAIALGSQVSTVHGVTVYSPRCSGVHTGLEFGAFGGNASGDNLVLGGYVSGSTRGINCEGYTNSVVGTFLNNNTIGFRGGSTEASARTTCYGLVINNSGTQAILLEKGAGYKFDSTWIEGTDDALTPTEVVKIGNGTDRCDNAVFSGITNVHLHESPGTPESYVFHVASGGNLLVEHLQISTSGGVPGVACLYQGAANAGLDNRIRRISYKIAQLTTVPIGLMGMAYLTADTAANAGTLPVNSTAQLPSSGTVTLVGSRTTGTPPNSSDTITYTGKTSTTLTGCTGGTAGRTYTKHGATVWFQKLTASHASATGEVIVEAAPGVVGAPAARIVGDFVPSPAHDYTFSPSSGGAYVVKARNGNVLAYSDECISPFNVAKGGNRRLLLQAGTFDQGAAWWKVYGYDWLTIQGEGYTTWVKNSVDDDSDDTEPFDFNKCNHGTVCDLRVSAGGTPDSNDSSDALDFDACTYMLVENVVVDDSRANGIVFDGKDDTAFPSVGNVVRNCDVSGCDEHGIKLLCCDDSVIEGGRYHGNGSSGLALVKSRSVTRWTQRTIVRGGTYDGNTGNGILIDECSDNTIIGANCRNNGTDGIRISSSASGSFGSDRNVIDLCIFADDQVSHTQDYGIDILVQGAACNGNVIGASNRFVGTFTAGDIRDQGTNTLDQAKQDFTVIVGDGSNAITAGLKGGFRVPYPHRIQQAETVGLDNNTGSIVWDVWRDSYGNAPPTVADTITASAKPTISSAKKATDATLTGWSRNGNAGDWYAVNVDSAATFTLAALALTVRKQPV